MQDNKPLVSAVELEALIQDWGASPYLQADRFFPLRFYFLFSVVLGTAVWLLFDADAVALSLTQEPNNLRRLQNFLYFRGWFLLSLLALGNCQYSEGVNAPLEAVLILTAGNSGSAANSPLRKPCLSTLRTAIRY